MRGGVPVIKATYEGLSGVLALTVEGEILGLFTADG